MGRDEALEMLQLGDGCPKGAKRLSPGTGIIRCGALRVRENCFNGIVYRKGSYDMKCFQFCDGYLDALFQGLLYRRP